MPNISVRLNFPTQTENKMQGPNPVYPFGTDLDQSLIPLQTLKKERSNALASAARFYQSTALVAAGYDDPALVAQCSRGEKNGAVVRGTLAGFFVVFTGGAFSFVGHDLTHSSFSPLVILCSMFLAVFLGVADHYVLVRAGSFPIGMRSLRHGGFPIDVPIGTGLTTRICVYARGILSLMLAAIIALFAGLNFNGPAIERRIATTHLQQNLTQAQRAEKAEDGKREAAKKRYDTAVATEQAIASENDRLVKQTNRSSSAKVADRLSTNETRLGQAQAAAADRKHDLDVLDTNRPKEIEDAIRLSPLYIPRDDSLIARVRALFAEIHDNPWVAIPLAFIDLFIIGFDLIMLTLKGIRMPSKYHMADARRHLGEMVREAQGAEVETRVQPSPPLAPGRNGNEPPNDPSRKPPSDPPNGHSGMNGATPPRRKRGRPLGSKNSRKNSRKNRPNQKNGGPDHE
jgi:Domain of unknown function (DUF4407)